MVVQAVGMYLDGASEERVLVDLGGLVQLDGRAILLDVIEAGVHLRNPSCKRACHVSL